MGELLPPIQACILSCCNALAKAIADIASPLHKHHGIEVHATAFLAGVSCFPFPNSSLYIALPDI